MKIEHAYNPFIRLLPGFLKANRKPFTVCVEVPPVGQHMLEDIKKRRE